MFPYMEHLGYSQHQHILSFGAEKLVYSKCFFLVTPPFRKKMKSVLAQFSIKNMEAESEEHFGRVSS